MSAEIPQIDKDAASPQADPVFRRSLHRGSDGGENSPLASALHCTITSRVGINVAAVAPQSKANSSDRAVHSTASSSRIKRRLNQNETRANQYRFRGADPQPAELIECHSLVQPAENLRMYRLQAHRDFQSAAQPVPEMKSNPRRSVPDGTRRSPARRRAPGLRRGVIFQRDRPPVEEAAAVVELDLACWR